eukprot:GILK01014910.1.p1 GENE.GILK01014910.1~~GILK01014910.1.p1  ORF type:complete len:105 (-),score=4.24 GILK01014910.1:264-578(-)
MRDALHFLMEEFQSLVRKLFLATAQPSELAPSSEPASGPSCSNAHMLAEATLPIRRDSWWRGILGVYCGSLGKGQDPETTKNVQIMHPKRRAHRSCLLRLLDSL